MQILKLHLSPRRKTALCLSLLLLLLAACRPAGSTPQVFFVEPVDGASLTTPVKVTMGAEAFNIEPAGEVRAGYGHLHIMVDTACLPAGQVIPKDDAHLHFGDGQMQAQLALALGAHRLCLQAADGAHTALDGDGMRQEITITVE
jgi:hypothetical protein